MPNPLDFVTEDQSGSELTPFEQAKMRGISIRPTTGLDVASAGNDPLTRMVAPEPPTDIMALIEKVKQYINGVPGTVGPTPGVDRVVNRLLGTGGEERFQTWPERMIRSGATLPGDVMSGTEPMLPPGLRREDVTDIPVPRSIAGQGNIAPTSAFPSDRLYERAQDVAGLAGGSALIERPGAASMGSGPVRQFRRGANENLNPETMANAPEFYVKPSRDELFVAPIKKEYKAYPEIDDPSKWRVIEISHDAYSQTSKDIKNGLSPEAAKAQATKLTTDSPTSYVVAGGKDDPHIGRQFKSEAEAKKFMRDNRKTVHDLYMRDPRMVEAAGRGYQGEDVHLTGFDTPEAAHEALAHLNSGGNYDLTNGFKMLPGKVRPTAELELPFGAVGHTDADGYTSFIIPKKLGERLNHPGDDPRSADLYGDIRQGRGYIMSPEGEVRMRGYWMDTPEKKWNISKTKWAKMPIEEKLALEVKQQATAYKPLKEQFEQREPGVHVSTLLSDTQQSGAAIAAIASSKGPAPVFYSALEHAATNAAQDVMSPQQWLGYLKNQPGVKAEELQWTGIGDWLNGQKGKVRKEDVQNYLDEHKVEIKDVTKGESHPELEQAVKEHMEEFVRDFKDTQNRSPTLTERQEMERHARANVMEDPDAFNVGVGNALKYSPYQLPGGENYREHLLTLPSRNGSKVKGGLGEQTLDPQYQNLDYKSSHWDEPNVLAHVRTNDRIMDAVPIADIEAKLAKAYPKIAVKDMASAMPSKAVREGVLTPQEAVDWSKARGFHGFNAANIDKPGTGVKSLHIEEIQSDWHQQGRKQGYKYQTPTPEMKAAAERAFGSDVDLTTISQADIRLVAKLGMIDDTEASLLSSYKDNRGVPDAPFKTSWPELALKRMIRHAAENGYDRVSWTPGGAQAARYDLSKQIDTADIARTRNGGYLVTATKDGRPVIEKTAQNMAELESIIGKDLAKKAGEQAIGSAQIYSGLDLKVGGEGMREFYDKMLPKMVERIGKAHGVKVKQGSVDSGFKIEKNQYNGYNVIADDGAMIRSFNNKPEADAFVKTTMQHPVHYFDLPQSLRDHAIGKGFPLYMSGVPFPLTPVDYDPFKKDK